MKIIIKLFLFLLKQRDKRTKNHGITKFELKNINLKNAKILSNRFELMLKMPKNAIVAEIGVNKGSFSSIILKTKPKYFHLIDSWGSDRYNINIEKHVKEKFISLDYVEINKGLSVDILKTFKDHYFDWVYLDTAHTYEVTIEELYLCHKKIKNNGIIAGHDYVTRSRSTGMKYGVIEAVHEFVVKENYEFIYLTLEWHGHNSFAIRKIID